ncbi:hypothetical protein D3C73_1377100 [compost metagenome]
MPADLRQGRLLTGVATQQGLSRVNPAGVATDAHHQHPTGTQMQRRTDRRRLTHRAITEILFADFHRGEQQRNGRTGEQVFNG